MHYNALSSVNGADVYVIPTLCNLAEVAKLMPQHTLCCAMHLPVALTAQYDELVYTIPVEPRK